jgi:lipopolysaccharide export LptBFGC system permease protein LptF
MTDQVDDDGFVKVERFKYKPVNNANKKKNKKRNKHIFKDPEEWTLEDVNKTLEERK